MKGQKESLLTSYPKLISYECTKKLIHQMKQNICKIKIEDEQGTGFFCKIPFPDKNTMLPVFITNNHLINKEFLFGANKQITFKIKEDTEYKNINLNNRLRYTNEEYDITIIEIKETDGINHYLELDDDIINDIIKNDNQNFDYIDQTIYIIQYPRGELSVSYGILKNIYLNEKHNFSHKCNTEGGSSGSPILSINNKLIGVHKEGIYNKFNKGIFLNYPIKEFIKKNYNILNTNKTRINNNKEEKEKFLNYNNDIEIINNENYNYNKNNILLNQFNKKYNLNITDTNINKLELGSKELGNEGLKYLSKIEFKILKELDVNNNSISDIKVLENFKFQNLEKLNLEYNKISDINILEKVNFKELKKLKLYNNNISDIKVLEKVNFEELEILDFCSNKITDINILANTKFENLHILDLCSNNISDITVFGKVKFEKLEILSLSYNKIYDINILEKASFKGLKYLYLSYNNISDIKILEKVKFEKLKKLNLEYNIISDINILQNVNFIELKELYLNNNKISDIKGLEKTKFGKLKVLYLNYNKVDIMESDLIISKLRFLIKDFRI